MSDETLAKKADFFMDQAMQDFPGEKLPLGEAVLDPAKVIALVEDLYRRKGKPAPSFNG